MKVRIISAIIGIAIFFAVLAAPPTVFYIFVLLIAATAIYELYNATGILKIKPLAASGIFGVGICAALGAAHICDNVMLYEAALIIMSGYVGIIFTLMVFRHEEVDTKTAATAFFGTFFIALLYSYIFALRDGEYGLYMIICLFAATWSADGGAYFAGVFFGKHKLAPVLSPKKTVEGAIGGVAASALAMVLYSTVLGMCDIERNAPALIFTGIVCAILGPVADIATSAIKREYNIKDYGNLIPGHGGALDRFDSVLLTAPAVFFIDRVISLIG